MTTRVIVASKVREFLESLAPDPRRKLWRGIKDLALGKGDIRQLDGKLAPNWRLRVGNMRVIFYETTSDGERQLICFFADYRATVYLVLEQLLASDFLEQLGNETGA
jgi:mRNA-degrading endonuclease RelE of RelBE toxin-antitoxin system